MSLPVLAVMPAYRPDARLADRAAELLAAVPENGNASSHFLPLRDTFRIHGALFANVFSRI